MPTSAVKHHDNPIIHMSGRHLIKKYLYTLSVDMRQYQ